MARPARLLAMTLAMLLGGTAFAHTPLAGIDYRERAAPYDEARNTIEVVEYFWYRCPHCYALEPLLESWLSTLPAGVRFRRVPAILGSEWALDARIFYALEALGELERLHRPLLDAIHRDGGRRLSEKAYAKWVADWVANHGVDRRRFEEALSSSSVANRANQAYELSKKLQLEGTPTFTVAARYVVSPPPGDRRRILQIVDYLVGRAQAERTAAFR